MLELKNVSFSAENDNGSKDIIKNVSLTIDEGFVALTGPNGGGKSTLAKLIAGIYLPTSGQILFNGKDITNATITERAKMGISYAFQQPVRFKGITVKDLVTLASGKNLSVADVCKYLSEVGLCAREYVDREVNASLSGGELKRIEIESQHLVAKAEAANKATRLKADAEAYQITVRAKAQADAIRLKAEALKENPALVELNIAEKWNGTVPQTVVTSSKGGSLLPLLNLNNKQ